MAYAAVISLKQTIHRLVNDSPQVSIISSFREMLESTYKEISSLRKILEGLQSRITNSSISKSRINTSQRAIDAINNDIREAANKLEDALESQVPNQFPISQSGGISLQDDDHYGLEQEINSFKQKAKKMEHEYNRITKDLESSHYRSPQVDDAVDFDANKSKIKMVGLSDDFHRVRDLLTRVAYITAVVLLGMAGIGKTALARKIFEDPFLHRCFAHRAFVTIGEKYQPKEILAAILAQISHGTCKVLDNTLDGVGTALRQYLTDKKYLIVLDDVWDAEGLNSIIRYCPGIYATSREFSVGSISSKIFVTTRRLEIADHTFSNYKIHRMRFMNKQESLYLLREKVLGRHHQPFPDEEAAEKIAENCGGLPLAIIAVAELLSKAEKTPHYWKNLANKGSLVFRDVGADMIEVLVSSYNYLPQHLKACFLYMGVFPPNCRIPASKLIKLWSVDGFLEPSPKRDSEDCSTKCLQDLASRSDLILVHQERYNISPIKSYFDQSRIKTCSLHPVYWYLCNVEAVKEKFVHVVHSSTQGIERQRRLCIHNNVLFGIEEVRNSMECNISMARSLLCTGPHHKYPLPRTCFGSRLLKVFDALTIRFYNFPIVVVELVELRYLALTYSGKIPAEISKLWKLEYLIVHQSLCDNQHLSIIPSGARTSLPIEIWNMQKLRCLQVMGSDLIIPQDGGSGALLSNLLTLSYMSADSCTKEILKRTPHLKRLGIQIELSPDDDDHPLHCFDHLADHLHQLEALKCVVVNPSPRSRVIAFPASNFPCNIRKLSLSGLGYPWDYMTTIGAQLPKLEVLKLRCYAFQGPEWVMGEEFRSLSVLVLEDIDLKYLRLMFSSNCLRDIIIKHCYNLELITNRSFLFQFRKFELVDCPLALFSAQHLLKIYADVNFSVRSSWCDEKPKSTTATVPPPSPLLSPPQSVVGNVNYLFRVSLFVCFFLLYSGVLV